MKSLEDRIKDLENERNKEKQVEILQEIGKLLLTKYKIQIGDLTIEPLLVEAYYYHPGKFDDRNTHGFGNHKLDKECRKLQSNRFDRLYFHKKGYGGVDVCLSKGDYCLSFLIKVALINGKAYKQEGIYQKLKKECIDDTKDVLVPSYNSRNSLVCIPRKNTHKGDYAAKPLAILSVESFKNNAEATAIINSLETGHKKQWVLAKYALEKADFNIENACEMIKSEGLYSYKIESRYFDRALKYIKEQKNG